MSTRKWAARAVAAVVGGVVLAAASPAQAQPADVSVYVSEASGTTGDVVSVEAVVTNEGTDPVDPVVAVRAPAGTVVVAADWLAGDGSCVDPATGDADWSEAAELECAPVEALAPEASLSLDLSFRIDGPIDEVGEVSVVDSAGGPLDSDIIDITYLGDRAVDLAITATSAEGEVGDVVDITFTVTNHGPDFGGPVMAVTAPAGTVAVAADSGVPGIGGCADPSAEGTNPNDWEEATELVCGWESALDVDQSLTMVISFRIDEAEIGDDGLVAVIEVEDLDPNPDNDTAPVVITVPADGAGGSLPVTGSPVVLFLTIGAGVLVLGGAMLLLARRRRVVLTTPDESSPAV